MNPEPPRCKAHSSRTGEPCQRFPTRGATVCATHGASTSAVKHAAARKLEEIRAVKLLGREQEAAAVTDPVGDLLRLAGRVGAWQRLLEDRVAELSSVTAVDRLDVERTRAAVELLERAIDRNARLLTDLAKINIADRQVRIDEAKAAILIRLVAAAMRKVNVPPQIQADLWQALKAEVSSELLQQPGPRVIEQVPGE